MFSKNYLILLLLLILGGCSTQSIYQTAPKTTLESFERYKVKYGPNWKYSLACANGDVEGKCMMAAYHTQKEANARAIDGCSQNAPDCIVVKENNKWVYVFSKEKYQIQAKQNKMDSYIKQCEYIGFKRNTEKLGECVLKISQTEKQLVDIQVSNSGGGGDNVANLILLQESLKLLNPPRATNNNVRCTFNNVGGIGAVNCF
jgi:hypothetical protein